MKTAILLLILLIVGIIIVDYLATSAIQRPRTPETEQEGVPVESESPEPVSPEPASPSVPAPTQTDSQVDIPEEIIPPSERSGAVYVSSVRRASASRPDSIRLKTRLKEGETVNITGWQIVTNDGSVYLPQAVGFYKIGGTNVETDLVLERGNYVEVSFVKSPIKKNFRLNMCTGYLDDRYEFYRSIPENCPILERDEYKHLSGECQNYIRSLGRCELSDPNVTNPFRGEKGNECRLFINDRVNVTECYESSQDDPRFFSDEWRVWLDWQSIVDSLHDYIRLFNRDGLLIDEYSY